MPQICYKICLLDLNLSLGLGRLIKQLEWTKNFHKKLIKSNRFGAEGIKLPVIR